MSLLYVAKFRTNNITRSSWQRFTEAPSSPHDSKTLRELYLHASEPGLVSKVGDALENWVFRASRRPRRGRNTRRTN